MSIVAAAWRRFSQAARWNGQAPHVATGAASVSASHCQLSNCSEGIIESSTTGSDNADAAIKRSRSGRVSSGSGPSFGSPAGSTSAVTTGEAV